MPIILRMRLDLKSICVVAFCLGGAATGSALLYRDMTGTGAEGQGAPMAQVLHAEKRVKHRLASSFAWNTVLPDQALFRRESIQTGPESAALIQLPDGTTLEVRENSLIVIDETKSLMTDFIRGSMILHQESGDSVMTVGNDGKPQIREFPVRLLSPPPSKTFFTTKENTENVRFEWKLRNETGLKPAQPIYAQISQDIAFKNKKTLTTPVLGLPAGRYFWRVVEIKEGLKEDALSAVAQFTVAEATPLTQTAPSENERIQYYGDSALVEFRWVEPPGNLGKQRTAGILGSIEHRLELSDDPQFENIIATKRVSSASQFTRIGGIPPGTLYWRIQSKWGTVSISTPAHSFQTERTTRESIELLAPLDRATLPETILRLSWRNDHHGPESQYSVEIESTQTNRPYTRKESTRAGGMNISSLAPASYRWRVRSIKKDQPVGESEWRTFSISKGSSLVLKAPFVNQRILFWKDPVTFEFQWDTDLLVTGEGSKNSFQIEVSRQADFKNTVVKKPTRKNSISSSEFTLEASTYYWRIQVIDESGSIQKTSETRSFTYDRHPLLRAPASASPDPETKLNPLELETHPLLSWSRVDGAVNYEVVVFRLVQGVKKLWLRQVTENASMPLKDAPEGTYFWSVRALDQLDRLGEPLADRKLVLDAGALLAPPKTLTKEVQ